jgi:hypothetical protein
MAPRYFGRQIRRRFTIETEAAPSRTIVIDPGDDRPYDRHRMNEELNYETASRNNDLWGGVRLADQIDLWDPTVTI